MRTVRAWVLGGLLVGACRGPATDLPEPGPPQSHHWTELPSLSDPIGVAGAAVGVVDGALVVAGGANFPDGRPWNGASKVWHDAVYLLESEDGEWREVALRLPAPRAYGVSVTWRDSLILAGGSDSRQHFAEVWRVHREGGVLEVESLPPLPRATAHACGAIVDGSLIVAGGRAEPEAREALHEAWALDLDDREAGWRALPPWPGAERMLAVAAGRDGEFLLIGGARLVGDGRGGVERESLTDALAYSPPTGWRALPRLESAVTAAPSPALVRGDGRVVVVGGDDGGLARTPLAELKDAHPGFRGTVQVLDPGADHWRIDGAFPRDFGPDPGARPELGIWPPVTTGTARWHGRYVIASGEARPGVRTARVFATEVDRAIAPEGEGGKGDGDGD